MRLKIISFLLFSIVFVSFFSSTVTAMCLNTCQSCHTGLGGKCHNCDSAECGVPCVRENGDGVKCNCLDCPEENSCTPGTFYDTNTYRCVDNGGEYLDRERKQTEAVCNTVNWISAPCGSGQQCDTALCVSNCGDGYIDLNPSDGYTEICDGNSETVTCGTDEGECSAGEKTRNCNDDCTWGLFSECSDVGPTIETCNGLDNDCDGNVDNDECELDFYCNKDGDDYINENPDYHCSDYSCVVAREVEGCVVEQGDDCDDTNSTVYPNAPEICINDVDESCSGQADDTCNCDIGDIIDCTKQGGVCAGYEEICGSDGVRPICDYNSYDANYELVEITCDTLDNDCDGRVDEGCDNDNDGYADEDMVCSGSFIDGNNQERSCDDYSGDCDDTSHVMFPGNIEVCDGKDNDCNDVVDDIAEENIKFCKEVTPGYSNLGVCEDKRAVCDYARYQGWFCLMGDFFIPNEICDDNLDNNCNGLIDDNCPCNPGDEQSCGSNIGECNIGKQVCNNQGIWGNCLDSISPVTEECDNLDNDCDGLIDEDLTNECSLDGCNGEQECSQGEWQLCIAVCSNILYVQLDNDDIGKFVIDGRLTQDEVKKALDTIKTLEQSVSYQYDEGVTEITSVINPENELKDVTYALMIPKCLTEYLDEIDFEDKNYRIIQDDPLIAWHFTEVNERVELGYKVQGEIPEDCLAEIKSMPIANVIGDKLGNQEEKDLKKQFIFPILFLIIIVTVVISLNKHKITAASDSDEDQEQAFIEKQRYKLLKEVKDMKFKSKQQAENYMKERSFGKETIEWILKKI